VTKIAITSTIAIDEAELEERFIHASGPGGQNVNKVATAVQLRFDVLNSASLPESVRRRLSKLAGRRMTQNGIIIITAQRFRSQERNREDARRRLVDLIEQAATPPNVRIATATPYRSKMRRLESKAIRAAAKKFRARPPAGAL
jgi:ribosome-associated protein